jgi:hypothetical protein
MDELRRLQAIDDEVRDIRVRRDAVVATLEQLRRMIGLREQGLKERGDKLAEAESWHRRKSDELESARDKLTKGKTKLSSVTRSREYVAVNKELDNALKEITQKEDEIAKLQVAIEEFRAAIGHEETVVNDLRTEATETERERQESLAEMEAKIAEADARRAVVTARLSPGIVSRYGKIAAARAGRAVVPVVDGCCKGCHMSLQPRVVEIILRGSSLESCPHCQRFLYGDTAHNADGSLASA